MSLTASLQQRLGPPPLDGQLRHAPGGARTRLRSPSSGTSTGAVPRPAGRHRGQRTRSRAPGRRRGGEQPGGSARPHEQPGRPPARRRCWPNGCATCRRGSRQPRAAVQQRRRGQRGGPEALPSAPPGRRLGRVRRRVSTAAPSAPRRHRVSLPKRAPFEPLPGPVTFVPYGDADALRAAVGPGTASVVLEPVLGRGRGGRATGGFLEAARQACDEHGALLHLDEVQGGVGRSGSWLTSTVTAPESCRTSSRSPRRSAAGSRSARSSRTAGCDGAGPGDHGHHVRRRSGRLRRGPRGAAHHRAGRAPGAATKTGDRLRPRHRGPRPPARAAGPGLGLWLGIVLTERSPPPSRLLRVTPASCSARRARRRAARAAAGAHRRAGRRFRPGSPGSPRRR
jgi:hypothetical protein